MNARIVQGTIAVVLTAGCAAIGYVIGRQDRSEPDVTAAAATDNLTPGTAERAPSQSHPTSVSLERGINAASEPDTIGPTSTDGLIARIHEVLAIKDYDERRYHNEIMFDNMTAVQAPEVFAALQELERSDENGQMKIFFFIRWGQVDGTAAVQAARQVDGRQQAMLTAMALRGWGESDPKAAWASAREIANGWPAMASRIGSIITNLAEQDLDAALAARNDVAGPFGGNLAQHGVLSYAVEQGKFDAVLHGVMLFDSVDDQKQWLNQLFSRWANEDADAPLAALENITDPVLAESAMTGFLSGWTSSDPEGALDYLLDHADDPAAQRALPGALARTISTANRETALALVDKVAAAGNLETTVPPVVGTLASSYPDLAIDLADKLSDDNLRRRSTAMVIGRWAQSDFDAATVRFEQLPDNESKRQAVMQMSFQALAREDGGERIARWLAAIPAGPDRAGTVELLLATAGRPQANLSAGSKQTLQELVAQTPDLSEQAQTHAKKLLGNEAAPITQP